MAGKECASRTHEPSLRELTAELDGVREVLTTKLEAVRIVLDERDHRYEDRFRAMDEKTGLALAASKEAVSKAENATEKRFEGVNEFRKTLSDQATLLMPRGEVITKFAAYDEKFEDMKKEIQSLRESRSEGSGEKGAKHSEQVQRQWVTGLVVFGALGFLGLLVSVVTMVFKK